MIHDLVQADVIIKNYLMPGLTLGRKDDFPIWQIKYPISGQETDFLHNKKNSVRFTI